jgi:hypothetical protein
MLSGPAYKLLFQSGASKYALQAAMNPGYYSSIFSTVSRIIPNALPVFSTVGQGVFNAVNIAVTSVGGPLVFFGIVAGAAVCSTAIYFYVHRDKDKFGRDDYLKMAGWALLSAISFVTIGAIGVKMVDYYFSDAAPEEVGKSSDLSIGGADVLTAAGKNLLNGSSAPETPDQRKDEGGEDKGIVAGMMEEAGRQAAELAADETIKKLSEKTGVSADTLATGAAIVTNPKTATAIGTAAAVVKLVETPVLGALKATAEVVVEGGKAGVEMTQAGAKFIQEHPQEVIIGLAVTAVLGTAFCYREDIKKGAVIAKDKVSQVAQSVKDTANNAVEGATAVVNETVEFATSSMAVAKEHIDREIERERIRSGIQKVRNNSGRGYIMTAVILNEKEFTQSNFSHETSRDQQDHLRE